MRIISSHTEELHMVSNNRNVSHDHLIREQIIGINRGHGGERRRIRRIEEKEEGFRPGGEPTVGSLKTLSGEHQSVKEGKGSSKNGGVVHGFNHRNREVEVVRWSVGEGEACLTSG